MCVTLCNVVMCNDLLCPTLRSFSLLIKHQWLPLFKISVMQSWQFGHCCLGFIRSTEPLTLVSLCVLVRVACVFCGRLHGYLLLLATVLLKHMRGYSTAVHDNVCKRLDVFLPLDLDWSGEVWTLWVSLWTGHMLCGWRCSSSGRLNTFI